MASPVRDARNRANQIWPGAIVIKRGPGWIKHRHPTNPNRFMFDVGVGNQGWHYGTNYDQEVDTAWVTSLGNWDWEVTKNDFWCYVRDSIPVSYRYQDAASGHYVELTVIGVVWANDAGQIDNATNFVQVTPIINDNLIKWTDIAPGWSVRVQAETGRLTKWLDILDLTSLGSPSVGGSNIVLRLRFVITKSANLGVFLDGVQWNEKNNTSVETDSNFEFRDLSTGKTVFWFKKPNAIDDGGNGANTTQRIRRTGNNYYVEIDVPWSWLQDAIYPISIDPSIDIAVGASAKDGLEHVNGTVENTGTQPNLGTTQQPYVGMIFNITEVPSGATVSSTNVTLRCSNSSRKVMTSNIDCEDIDTPPDYPSYTPDSWDISTRTVTGNPVAWSDTGASGQDMTSPEFVTPAQTVVNRSGFNGYLNVILHATDSTQYQHWSYDGDTTYCGRLHLEYTTGGYEDSLTLARTVSISGVTNLVIGAGLSLNKDLGAMEGTTLDTQDALSFARTLLLLTTGEISLDVALNLAKILAITLTSELGEGVYNEALGLAKSLGYTVGTQLDGVAALSLAKQLAISFVSIAIFDVDATFAKQAGISLEADLGGYFETLSLARYAGLTNAVQGNLQAYTTFLKTLAIVEVSQGEFEAALAFTKSLGITNINNALFGVALTIAKALTTSMSSEIAPPITQFLALTLYARLITYTLDERTIDLSLANRQTELTIKGRNDET